MNEETFKELKRRAQAEREDRILRDARNEALEEAAKVLDNASVHAKRDEDMESLSNLAGLLRSKKVAP